MCLTLVGTALAAGRSLPSGPVLAFTRYVPSDTSAGRVYILDLISGLRLPIHPASDNAVWSPDGQQLIFSARYNDSNTGHQFSMAYSYHMNTQRTVDLSNSLRVENTPVVSPDGRSIAFVSNQVQQGGEWEIFTVDVASGELRNLSNHPATDRHPVWSPDGRSLAFESYRDGNSEIYLVEVESGALRRITHNSAGDSDVTWSPDGRYLAYVTSAGYPSEFINDIYTYDLQSDTLRRITYHAAGDFEPAWSPDGRTIAFISERDDGREVYLIDADVDNDGVSDQARRLSSAPPDQYDPAWSPDGQWIAFALYDSPAGEIVVVNVESGEWRNVTDHPGNDFSPTWRP